MESFRDYLASPRTDYSIQEGDMNLSRDKAIKILTKQIESVCKKYNSKLKFKNLEFDDGVIKIGVFSIPVSDLGVFGAAIDKMDVVVHSGIATDGVLLVLEFKYKLTSGGSNGNTVRYHYLDGKWEIS